MADNSVVHLGENSPEHVAFKLLQVVAGAEKKELYGLVNGDQLADRKWILSTYRECLKTVKGHLTPNNRGSDD